MSLYEYWCEQYGPQPRGSVEFNTQHIAQKSGLAVALKVFMASVLTGLLLLVTTLAMPLPGWHSAVVACGLVLIYVGVSFFVVPAPNTDNLGWMGGMVDDPFQYSDDWNRSLVFFSALLGPGRFIAGTLLDVAACCGIAASEESQDIFGFEEDGHAPGVSTANASAVDLPAASKGVGYEESQQETFGLTTAKFLINDDA